MTFGLRLKEWIKSSGYTQNEFSEKIGVSRVAISNYIAGKYEPKRDFFDKLRELGADKTVDLVRFALSLTKF